MDKYKELGYNALHIMYKNLELLFDLRDGMTGEEASNLGISKIINTIALNNSRFQERFSKIKEENGERGLL